MYNKNVSLVQFADDMCIWINVFMRKNTVKRPLNHVRKLCQADLDKLSNPMLVIWFDSDDFCIDQLHVHGFYE